jgi:predicted ATPase/DNA-binding SARP family transcriptional activator
MVSSASPLSIQLFGGFEAQVRGRPIPKLRSRKEQWLLALLALEHAAPVPRTKLAQMLWPFPDHATDQAGYNLRRSLTELRRALGTETDRLVSPTPRTIRLAVDGAEIDVLTFDAALAHGDHDGFELAVSLYRGPFLPECVDGWAIEERTKREHAYLLALEALASDADSNGDLTTAIRYLRQCLAVDPIRELACRALMETLARSGEYNAALLVYQEFSRRLHRLHNALPDAETTTLFHTLRAEARRRAPTVEPSPLPEAVEPPHLLPAPLTSLIGREEQVRGIIAQLESKRMVTLTGSGGVGKTRLAIQVAEDLAGRYRDGIYFVELGALTDPTLVPQTVASTLDIREETGHPLATTLTSVLQRRRLLLILDGCEHLIVGCSELGATLLRGCRNLCILATSRQPLAISGETLWRVPSLSLPDPRRLPSDDVHLGTLLSDYAAIRLFVDRAGMAQPGFQLTPQNARDVMEICTRLDGIPLAIELAAARIKALTTQQLARRLNRLFRLLTDEPSNTLSRQATMEATIRWSYDLLDPPERLLLARLSVFTGGWTLEAAEAVVGDDWFADGEPTTIQQSTITNDDVLKLTSRLVDRSLLLFEEVNGFGRYRMLETVRQFAHERLIEQNETTYARGRHLAYFLGLAEEAEPTLFGSGAETWLPQLEQEHDNLRAALTWSLNGPGGGSEAIRLAAALWRFWYRRGYLTEGRGWLAACLKCGETTASPARASVCNGAGFLAFHQGDVETARSFFHESLDIAESLDDRRLIATALHHQAYMAWYLNDFTTARSYYEQEIAILRELDDRSELASTLCQLGIAAGDMGDTATAGAHFGESLEIAQQLGDRALIATTLHS